MDVLIFDIETNAIDFKHPDPPSTANIVHCLVLTDGVDTRRYRHNAQENTISEGLAKLQTAEVIAGHNITGFDLPVLEYLYSWKPASRVVDTLLLSQMRFGDDLRWLDTRQKEKGTLDLPPRLVGRHSLDAWGHRLGLGGKDGFAERKGEAKWTAWSQDMEDYCAQDVAINAQLLQKFVDNDMAYSRASYMESALAGILQRTTAHGWSFDEASAVTLMGHLSARREALRKTLVSTFGGHWIRSGKLVTPKRTVNYKDVQRGGLTKGAPYQPVKYTVFNPASGDHIAHHLKLRYGWKPVELTDTGKPKVDESTLSALSYPMVAELTEYMMLNKRLGQLSEGNQAWLKLVRNGRIHGQYKQLGTRTGRMSHARPNIAQVPRTGNPYGTECRRLFRSTDGLVMVGADASGIELRMLAHYAHRYDNGELAKVVLEGDVHAENQAAVGLASRDSAKTFIYALLYGAGDEKLGSIIKADGNGRGNLRSLGKAGRAAIEARFPGYGRLAAAVREKAKRTGTLRAIDGRTLRGVSAHNGLNTLLQGAAGILMKAALVEFAKQEAASLWKDTFILGHIHDEIQVETEEEYADDVGMLLVAAIKDTGINYGLNVPLDGEYKIGTTWAETH